MKLSLNKAHFPVTVLGPGRRIGIWLQGCSIRCRGCISQDTWSFDKSRETTIAHLMRWCREASGGEFDGVTISGGEPFDQAPALTALIEALIRWRQLARRDFDLLCYSGYPLATLQKKHARILSRLDALIPEPFVERLSLTHVWRGSANQPLIPLSARGEVRYARFLNAPAEDAGKRMQITLSLIHI